jgi:hypothetical protein
MCFDRLQAATLSWALRLFRLNLSKKQRPEGIIDSTGLESRHVSRYFRWKSESCHPWQAQRSWPKITIVAHRQSHFIFSLNVSRGPNQDSHLLRVLLPQTTRLVRLDRLLADAGYDAEANHVLCRDRLGIRSTVIPARHATYPKGNRCWPRSKYRRQMRRRFHKLVYRQRWQIECVMFRLKRHFGQALSARRWMAQVRECRLRVWSYNLLILAEGLTP